MKRNEALPSNYLGKDDFPKPCLAQIAHVVTESVKTERGEETKPVLYIMGPSYDVDVTRGIILNGTNWDLLEEITGKADSDDWKNAQIVLYVDPNVRFAGKKVGGIRVRAPKAQQAPAPPEPEIDDEPPAPTGDDDVPF